MKARILAAMMGVALVGGAAGCSWFKRKKPQPPPAPTQAPAPAPEPAKVVAPPTEQPKPTELPMPVGVDLPPKLPAGEGPEIVQPKTPEAPKPAEKKQTTRRRRRAPPKPAPEKSEATVEVPAPAPGSAPTLGEMLPAEEAREYERSITADLESARRALAAAANRTLNRDQTETVERMKSFVDQAEETRRGDLRTAAQLAHRAALLGKDLLESLQ
jgi:type IV secretory pathway VirB10-like protein